MILWFYLAAISCDPLEGRNQLDPQYATSAYDMSYNYKNGIDSHSYQEKDVLLKIRWSIY